MVPFFCFYMSCIISIVNIQVSDIEHVHSSAGISLEHCARPGEALLSFTVECHLNLPLEALLVNS